MLKHASNEYILTDNIGGRISVPLEWQSGIKTLEYETVNGVLISRSKDQAELLNHAVLFAETRFPCSFHAAKWVAVKLVTSG